MFPSLSLIVPTILLLSRLAWPVGPDLVAEDCQSLIAPQVAKAQTPRQFASLNDARHRIKVANKIIRKYVGGRHLQELDRILKSVATAEIEEDLPELEHLSGLFGKVEAVFAETFRRDAPRTSSQLSARLTRAEALGQTIEASVIRVLIDQLANCLDRVDTQVCGSAWQRADRIIATNELTEPGPVEIESRKQMDRTVSLVTNMLELYVPNGEVAEIQQRYAEWRSSGRSIDSVAGKHLVELLRVPEARFLNDVPKHIDRVLAELRAHLNRHDNEADRALLLRLAYCRDRLRLDECALAWDIAQRADWNSQRFPGSIEDRLRPFAAEAILGKADPTNNDFDFVMDLDALGNHDLRMALKMAFAQTFATQKAIHRDSTRMAQTDPGRYIGWVSDLNQAHTIFTEPPVLVPADSKAILRGPVAMNARVVTVDLIFDPRARYFTVTDASTTQDRRNYYVLLAGPDGRLTFLADQPVSRAASRRLLRLTHFAY